MSTLRVGIMGAGPAAIAHARGYSAAGGYRLEAICDLIPARVQAFQKEFPSAKPYDSLEALVKDPGLDVLSICLPTHLHAEWGVKSLRKGKHVVIETPLASDISGARALVRAAEKSGKVLLPALQRHWGSHEMAARQAVEKGFLGTPYHARASWIRGQSEKAVPQGTRQPGEPTGWYTNPALSGGGAASDLGLHILEVAWSLLQYPKPQTVFATSHARLTNLPVEEFATALIEFEGGASLELSSAWALRLPPSGYGVSCRVSGSDAALDVYTPTGPTLYRGDEGKLKSVALKGPKVTHHPAMMRTLKTLLTPGEHPTPPLTYAQRTLTLARILEAIYKSASTGKSADVKE